MKFEWKKHWYIPAAIAVALLIWGFSGFPMPILVTPETPEQVMQTTSNDCSKIEQELRDATSLVESLQLELNQTTDEAIDCDERYAQGLAAGRQALANEQDSVAKVRTGLQVDNMGIHGVSLDEIEWHQLNVSSEEGLTNMGFGFIEDNEILRGVYSNPQRLQNDYNRAKRWIRPAFLFLLKTGKVPDNFKTTCQEWLRKRLYFCRATSYDAEFEKGWENSNGREVSTWNTPEYWSSSDNDNPIPHKIYGMDSDEAAIRWKYIQRRMDEAEEYHGFNRQQTQNIWRMILTDLQTQLR